MSFRAAIVPTLLAAAALSIPAGCGGGRASYLAPTGDAGDGGADSSPPDADRAPGDGDPDGPDGDEPFACPDGYQDNDGDGVCAPTCETAGLRCRGPAHCDDSSGELRCVCDEGYQDHDRDGSCLPDCATAALDCGEGGLCDDSSGAARCRCLEGWQDNDGDGVCALGCDGAVDPCGLHGACEDGSGAIECRCDETSWGERCERCRPGYQDHDGDGVCRPDCRTARLACPGPSHCEDGSGVAVCVCDEGHEGPGCASCAPGHQDHDGDGVCRPDCATAAIRCTGPGACDDSSGTATCVCSPGHQDHDRDGSCLPDCATAVLDCGAEAACDDSGGVALCRCLEGWQDHDGDGVCRTDCATAALECGARRHCDDRSGVASCVCDRGWAGEGCEGCAPGFEPGVGGCVPDHDWAVLVYMNGDNSLEPHALDDLAEIADAGSSDRLHLVVLLDTYSGGGDAWYVEPGAPRLVESWGEPDMGDWRTLRDFGVWAVERYPARRTALVVWNHGDGWKAGGRTAGFKAVAGDAHGSPDGISVAEGELARALAGVVAALGGERLALLGFDACLMGMWEVAHAVAPFADVMVASSELEPVSGWPYRPVLRALRAAPTMTARALAERLVDDYHAASPLHFTLAATDLGAAGALATAVDELAAALLAAPSFHPELERVRAATQGFDDPDFRDLRDLADRLAATAGAPPEVADAAARLSAELAAAVFASRAQPSHPGSHGLSVYLPPRGSPPSPAYRAAGASWSADTLWDELLLELAASP